MNSDGNGSAAFWLDLLLLGDDEQQRRQIWNDYCKSNSAPFLELLPTDEWKRINSELEFPNTVVSDKFEKRCDQLAEKHGGHPQPLGPHSFMDFSGMEVKEMPKDVSFAGRLLIGANFQGRVFRGRTADFSGAEFIGPAEFADADFSSMDPGSGNGSGACFTGTRFHGSVNFRKAKFCGTSFAGAELQGEADFPEAAFHGSADFSNARFRGTTSFENAKFSRPPKFFEAELHEDVTFSGVDWTRAEASYRRPRGASIDAERAMRAWDRLALMMNRQEKPTERHEFHRLMMRARRRRDGWRSLSSVANWLFDKLSDYGWGIGRAFSWWCLHILAGAGILTVATNCLMMAWNALQVSFANSLAFLRLGSEGGYLHLPHEELEKAIAAADAGWIFSLVGTVQAVLGPILLFLVLLTLRNHFRLG